MALTDYTTYEEVRAALGVSAHELKDETLALPIYLTELTEQLREIHPDLDASYQSAKTAGTQERFVSLVQMYCAYAVAQHALGRIEMFAPRVIKDARAEMERAENPFKQLREDVASMLGRLRTRLLAAYAEVNPAAPVSPPVARVIAINVPLGVDPVTG